MKYFALELEEIDSTNLYIKRNVDNLNNFTFVSSKKQTFGHGRYNRIWESQEGENLLCSLLIKDKSIIEKWEYISTLIPCSILNVLTHFNINNTTIKWPNDIYYNDKKLCGILIESQLPKYLIIGIGINVNQKTFSTQNATSIFLETNKYTNLENFKSVFYNQIIKDLETLIINPSFFMCTYKEHNYLFNKVIKFEKDNNEFSGRVIGVDDKNHLLVEVNERLFSLDSGEVNIKK